MKKEIIINGVTYVPKEELKEECLTGYERAKYNNSYWYWDASNNSIVSDIEYNAIVEDDYYDTGNYYTSKSLAENNARADKLTRRLRRWQALNDNACDWRRVGFCWYIAYDSSDGCLCAYNACFDRIANVIYFTTEEKAKKAIEYFHNELMWYFTEYKQRLDEPKN